MLSLSSFLSANTVTEKHRLNQAQWKLINIWILQNISFGHFFWQVQIPCIGFETLVCTLVDLQIQYWTKNGLSRTADTIKVMTGLRKGWNWNHDSIQYDIFRYLRLKKVAWNYCKHPFPNLQCQWVALVANSCYWSSILSIRVHQKCDVASYFNEFCYRVVNVAAHDYSNYSPCGLSIPSCIFHKPLGQEKCVFDVCRQKLAFLYFKKWFGRQFHLGILFVNEAFVPQNRIITIVEGQNRFDVSCTLGCEQKRVLIDWKRTLAVFDSTHESICKVRFSVM